MGPSSTWTFLTNHAIVLLHVAERPRITLRELSDAMGITERAVSRIVTELAQEGYLGIHKDGRRNVYEVRREALLRRPETRGVSVGALLALLTSPVEGGARHHPSAEVGAADTATATRIAE